MQVANAPPPDAASHAPDPTNSFLSHYEGQLAIIVIALGVVVLFGLSLVLWKKDATADEAIRAYTLVLILIGTIVLICAGYSNDQIAPAMGLFGTIAGYLLGRKGSQ